MGNGDGYFAYDQYSNMWLCGSPGIAPNGSAPAANYCSQTPSNIFNNANQIIGRSYDGAGNMASLMGSNFSYDAENRITTAVQPGIGTVTYTYDGDGRRVMKAVSTGLQTVYVYDIGGKLVAEYSSGAVSVPPCHTCFLSTDHLGSTRLVTDENGNTVSRHGYIPFGEEIQANSGGRDGSFGTFDFVNQKFTGKERDQETGLDYFGARYYGSTMGRFMSPDDGSDQNPGNPQSWNLYSYGRNNPLIGRDDDGHTYNVCDASGKNCSNIDDKTFEAEQKQDQKNGESFANGTLSHTDANGNTVKDGSFTHDPDIAGDPASNIAAMGQIGNQGMSAIKYFAAGSVIGGAVGAAGLAYSGVMSVTVPSIIAPLLPVMPSTIDKLQKIGVSIQEANQIVNSPASQKLVDNLNSGNINYVQDIGGKMIRITTDPTGQRIISAGTMRANQITNGLANGRFTK